MPVLEDSVLPCHFRRYYQARVMRAVIGAGAAMINDSAR